MSLPTICTVVGPASPRPKAGTESSHKVFRISTFSTILRCVTLRFSNRLPRKAHGLNIPVHSSGFWYSELGAVRTLSPTNASTGKHLATRQGERFGNKESCNPVSPRVSFAHPSSSNSLLNSLLNSLFTSHSPEHCTQRSANSRSSSRTELRATAPRRRVRATFCRVRR